MQAVEGITKRHIVALIGCETALLAVACVYAAAAPLRHSPEVVDYVAFILLCCVLTAFLWYVFVARQISVHGVRATPRRLAAVVALSAGAAIFLEWGTLFGAPLSSPLVWGDWHVSRIVIFFVMTVPVCCCIVLYDWRSLVRRRIRSVCADGKRPLKRLCGWVGGAAIASIVAACVAGIVCASSGVKSVIPYQAFAASIAVVVVGLVGLHRSMAEQPERGFLLITMAAGVLLVTIVPLYTHISWDDHIHYDRAVSASYLFDPEYTPGDAALVGRAYDDVAKYSRAPETSGWINPYDYERLDSIRESIDKLGDDDTQAVRVDGFRNLRGVGTLEYYSIAYIPAAVALWIARLLMLPTTTAFLLGRLATLVCYALVTYFACKRLKSGKMILATCALIPTAVFLASGYSYDYWLMSFTMLGFACFIGELQRPDEPLQWRWFLLMVAAFLVGLGPKAVYVPLAATLLFMPRAKFAFAGKSLCTTKETMKPGVVAEWQPPALTHKRYIVLVFASAAFVLSTFVLPMFFAGPGPGDARGGEVNPSAQVAFIISQPLAYFEIFVRFFIFFFSWGNIPFVFTDFCGVETSHAAYAIFILLLAVALTDRSPGDASYATHGVRLSMIGLALLTFFLICTALFISFTPEGSDWISGVQGRYLLPMLFPLLALCFNFRPFARLGTQVHRVTYHYGILVLSGVLLFGSIAEVLIMRF